VIEALLTVGAIALLLLVQGFFSGSEIALVDCDKSRLKHRAKQGHSGSRLVLRMFERPEVILATTLVGTNVALVMATVLGTTLLIDTFGASGGALAVVVLTPLVLLFGEVIPKSVYQQESDRLAPWIIYPLYAMSILLFPIVFVFSKIARLIARFAGKGRPGADLFAVREQLRAVLEAAEGAAPEHPFDRIRIRNVVRFGELVASDLMVPAAEMTGLSTKDDIAHALELVRRTGLTHVPTYEGERNTIVGMAHLAVWDLIDPGLRNKSISDVTNPALFVPALQPATELLPLLRSREDESAIVVDEYGSAVGLVNVRMVLAAVVEKSAANARHAGFGNGSHATVEELGDDSYLVDARMPITDVNELLAIHLSTATAHSIGGLVEARLRHVPQIGESMTEQGFMFSVEEATERMATRLRITRQA